MMISVSNELKMIDKAAFEYSRKILAPEREENDKFPYGPFFDHLIEKAYDLDFFHSLLPESLGGIGQSISAICTILENISREDSSLGGIILTTTATHEILLAADAQGLLKQLTENADTFKKFMVAYPLFSNPSETNHLCIAEKNKNGYSLSGAQEFLVLGGISDHAIIPTKMKGEAEYSFFLVNLNDAGVEKSEPIQSLGLHSCPAADVSFAKVKGKLIGKQGDGETYFEAMASRLSIAAAAMACGIMKGSFKEAADYCKKRVQGGRKIIDWSEVKMTLAQMAINLKTAEMVVSSACQAMENNEPDWQQCAKAAAIHVHEMACNLTNDGIQVMGGVGYMKDFGQEKRFRDAKHIQAVFGLTPMKKLRYLESIV
ncbi:MAG: acyl-CoA/acyl-ACP dehydrogenase [Desulfobacteraceae bacterium]|nr:acyl-CoA/acyl-ACP dehydrogenase [Desulfobacteraceae bacterium]MBC2755876.1 acyl-CoA/acyl-ACP dehydrogenase [Desulfobacteraceae bacterium]MBC2763957.1 acyl-CoA/acyl-ACP dehydrogenase [ANME-2 cluster archaeon]